MDLNNTKSLNVRHFPYFEEYYENIWKMYRRYGEQVLEVDLGDTEEEIKEIFLTSENHQDFLEKISTFWRNRYQIIIRKPSDIPKAVALNVLSIDVEEDENSLVLVSKDFFEKLKENSSKNSVYILVDENLYIVIIKHNCIEIQDIINKILKD